MELAPCHLAAELPVDGGREQLAGVDAAELQVRAEARGAVDTGPLTVVGAAEERGEAVVGGGLAGGALRITTRQRT